MNKKSFDKLFHMQPLGNSIIIYKKKKRKNWFSIVKAQAIDFCLATGLHGYKYIVQSNRTKAERYLFNAFFLNINRFQLFIA
jgi:hypothetical protein